jgi:hypothetical protein
MWLEEIIADENDIENQISILRAVVVAVAVGNILNVGAAVAVVAAGANENVPVVAGFATGKPNDAPVVVVAAVLVAGNNEGAPEAKINQLIKYHFF